MGMGSPEPLYYTADMVRDLIDESRPAPRYETVYGELLVSPAPRPWHQVVAFRLARALADYLDREQVGSVFTSPSDISWGRDDVLVQPDVLVIPDRPTPTLKWSAVVELLLAAEVLSPSNARHDRFTKRRLYQAERVPLYWIVDADDHSVEIWTPDAHFPHTERESITWRPAGAAEPFTLRLADLFRSG